MKAIVTTCKGPTDHRGSRIVASDEDGNRITVAYDHALSGEAAHRIAAEAFCKYMGWTGDMVCGSVKRGYVFVFVS